ncbi:MAG: TIGR00730 family Rossman fold protein [Thermodesulfobacteriota bacterium]
MNEQKVETSMNNLNNSKVIDERFFIEGPHTRTSEFWQVLKVLRDFFRGFRTLHFVGPCVTVFGSARVTEESEFYKQARELGKRIAESGLTVMTGGGPGIMEAANRGANEAGGKSIGCNIRLPLEQEPNKYLDKWVTLHYFFVRKVMLFKYSYAFVVMPGGVGTMDEFFEAITLIQNKKILNFPLVLIGKRYFQPLMRFLDSMIQNGMIDKKDMDLLLLTDSIHEAIEYIDEHATKRFGLDLREIPKPSIILGEK